MPISAVALAAACEHNLPVAVTSLCGYISANLVFGVAFLAVIVASYFMKFEMVGFTWRLQGKTNNHLITKHGDIINYEVLPNNKPNIKPITSAVKPEIKPSPETPTKCQKCGSLDITKAGSNFFTGQGKCKNCANVVWKHSKVQSKVLSLVF